MGEPRGQARSTQLPRAQGSTCSALLPSPSPTHVLHHQLYGPRLCKPSKTSCLAWVEANKCYPSSPWRASRTWPHETSAPKSPRAFSRASTKMPQAPDPTYLAPNDHRPRHKHLRRVPPDAWRRQRCGVTPCLSRGPGGRGRWCGAAGQSVPSGRAVAYGCTW